MLILLSLISYLLVFVTGQYEVPDATFEILSPRGFKVSIPYEDGIEIFAFHGHVNKEIHNREAGTFSVDITKPADGKLTYWERTTKLKPGDIIYYWTYVQFLGRGYPRDDQMYRVSGTATSTTTTQRTTEAEYTPTTSANGRKTTPNPNCRETATTINRGKRTCRGRLILQENFGASLSDRWLTEIRFADSPDYEFVTYTDDPDVIFTKMNNLHIKPMLAEDKYGVGYVTGQEVDLGDRCTGKSNTVQCVQKPIAWVILPPVLSAQISTRNSFSFRYGMVEIRAKLPRGDWIYPELYLRPKEEAYGSGYDSGQIVIAFLPGNPTLNNKLAGGCIMGSTLKARKYAVHEIHAERSWSDDYHIFQVKWKPDDILVSVDNQTYSSCEPPEDGFSSLENELQQPAADKWRAGSNLAPFDKEMYVTIGVGVGGQSFPDDIAEKPWRNGDPKNQLTFYRAQDVWRKTWNPNRAQLIIDHVRVYAL